MATPTAQYSCSQPALYQASNHIIQALSKHQEAFSGFKSRYTKSYITMLNEQLTKAENLADYKARLGQTEINYINLCNALSQCTELWQKLKRYIKSAYGPSDQKQYLEEAGFQYYKKTVARNWDAANALLISTKNFLSRQSAILTSNQNMPEGFATTFVEAYTNFSRCLLTFQQSEKETKTATLHKLNTNNILFATITEICQDGQLLFKNQKDIKDEFVFNTVLRKITGAKKQEQELHRSDNTRTPESANNAVLIENN